METAGKQGRLKSRVALGVDARLFDGEEATHSSARKTKPARYKVAHNAMKRGAGSKRLVFSLKSCCFL